MCKANGASKHNNCPHSSKSAHSQSHKFVSRQSPKQQSVAHAWFASVSATKAAEFTLTSSNHDQRIVTEVDSLVHCDCVFLAWPAKGVLAFLAKCFHALSTFKPSWPFHSPKCNPCGFTSNAQITKATSIQSMPHLNKSSMCNSSFVRKAIKSAKQMLQKVMHACPPTFTCLSDLVTFLSFCNARSQKCVKKWIEA